VIAARIAVIAVVLFERCPRHEPAIAAAPQPESQPAEPAREQPAPPASEPPVSVAAPAEPTKTPSPTEPDPPVPASATSSASIDDFEGKSRAELIAKWGEPDDKARAKWTYRFPRPPACTDRELVFVLTLQNDRVTAVDRSIRQTGKQCAGEY